MNTTTIAKKISSCLLRIQLRFATLMGSRTAGCSARKLKLLSALFLLPFFLLSTVIIFRAINSKEKYESLKPQHIRISRPIPAKQVHPVIVTKELYQQLQDLKSQHVQTRIHLSTGMLDSIDRLEKIYLLK